MIKGLIFWIIVIMLFLIMSVIAEFLVSIVTIEFIVNTFVIIGILSSIYLFKEVKNENSNISKTN